MRNISGIFLAGASLALLAACAQEPAPVGMSPIFDKYGDPSCPGGYSLVDDICVPRPDDRPHDDGSVAGTPAGGAAGAGTGPTTGRGTRNTNQTQNTNQNTNQAQNTNQNNKP
ncbi:hypothetical protein [Mesobacterium pallidum]|uniref:hypothetical protein n=1 Tax=Mesobacterium pallidum TaxID=2872037 RepID=UPI001EE19B2A|nr:hypothetical protein [Mesobacterium pallidum]